MASVEDMTITIRVRVVISFWQAIKLRIAGLSALKEYIEQNLQKQETDAK